MVVDTVPAPVDVVVTSAAGYPLDTTFYQAVKGLTGAPADRQARWDDHPGGQHDRRDRQPGVRQPVPRECESGNLRRADPGQAIISCSINGSSKNWPRSVARHEVKIITDGLPAETINGLFVESAPSVEAAVAESLAEYGPTATIAVIPKGPYVLAQVAE